MNKFFLAATATVMAIGVAMPVAAAINARQIGQRNSIDAGVRTGKLTAHEARILRQEQDLITRAKIHTYDDHRMAMSFALAGLKREGVTILEPGCVAKTFPDYFQRFAGIAQ